MTISFEFLHMDVPKLTAQQKFGCSLEDLSGAMDDSDGWLERESRNSVLLVRLDDDDDDDDNGLNCTSSILLQKWLWH